MGAVLLAGGSLASATLAEQCVMIHQPLGGAQGQASDIEIQAREILKIRERLNEIIASHAGKSLEDVAKDTDRDYFMTAEEAREYGIVDEVLNRNDEAASANEGGA